MKQLLLRIDDDLHQRITRRARRTGRSINATAGEILAHGVSDEALDARAELRARARRLGVLAEQPPAPPVTEADRERALAATRGIGPILDELWAEGR
ncbi:FitA-like ribbon-helix-helix domain-containing protein [Streptosporangium amethystogenes]|uniref:FitA-like ribbon-helix-helix domain-containing protein n=1 Tax=Streptosporangium amethystogenes TaxID=2002 RepID=UPI0037AA8686